MRFSPSHCCSQNRSHQARMWWICHTGRAAAGWRVARGLPTARKRLEIK